MRPQGSIDRDTPFNRRLWLDALEKLGPENVRPKMSYGNAGPDPWDPVRGICDEPPERYFVENWLGGKDRQKQKSDRINICASIVAAVAGIAAVVIGLIALFR